MKEAYSLAIGYDDSASIGQGVPVIAAAAAHPASPTATAAAATAAAAEADGGGGAGSDSELALEEVCTGRTPPQLRRPKLSAAAAAERLRHSRQVSGIFVAEDNGGGSSATAAEAVEQGGEGSESIPSSNGVDVNQVGEGGNRVLWV